MQPKRFVQETPDLCRVTVTLPLEAEGPEAEDAALDAGVDAALHWLRDEKQLIALDEPEAEVLESCDGTLTAELTVPLLPREAVLEDCTDLHLRLCPAPVPQRVLEGRLELLRLSHYTLEKTDAPAGRNDVVFFDYTVPGTSQRGEGFQMTVGGPEPCPGLGAALCGKKAGEEFTCPLPGDRACCGVLRRVCRKKYPELDDAFARAAGGCGSLKELRARLEEQLREQEMQKARGAALEKAIAEAAARLHAPEVSAPLADLYSARLTGRMKERLFPGKGAFEAYLAEQKLTPAQFAEKNRAAVCSRIRKRMALLLLAEQQKLAPTPEDSRACEQRLAREYGIGEAEVHSRCPRSVFALEVSIQAAERWLARECV